MDSSTYRNENKSIGNNQSTISVVNDGLIMYMDGSKPSKPKYVTKSQPGVLSIENMSNGGYTSWVTYREEHGGRTYSSYKVISVNHDYRGKSEKKVLQTSMQNQGLYVYQSR